MDANTLWLMTLGVMAIGALWLAARRKRKPATVIPVILRRRELQEELDRLLPTEEAARLVRAEAARSRRPTWDVAVLERCVAQALAAKAKAERQRILQGHATAGHH